MPKKLTAPRVFTRECKCAAVERMLAGENVCALARELGVLRQWLYEWKERVRLGGAEALHGRGRPGKGVAPRVTFQEAKTRDQQLVQAQQRIAELERAIGRQALELDCFAQALRHIGAADTQSGSVPPSTPQRRKAGSVWSRCAPWPA